MSDRESGLAHTAAWQIAVGDELLIGRTVDTNSGVVQRALAAHGVEVRRVTVVRDDRAAIVAALAEVPVDGLVFLSGGLGSTPDDITKNAVAAWAGVPLVEDAAIAADLKRRARERTVIFGEELARQALVPSGMRPLPNPAGTAPGLVGRLEERDLVVLPGVPGELRALLPEVMAWLVAAGMLPRERPSLLLRTAQVAELDIVELCRPVLAAHPDLRWSWWLARWGVDVGVTLPSGRVDVEVLDKVRRDLRRRLGLAVFADRLQDLNEVVQERMLACGGTLGVAESCTGGLLGGRLTDLPGSSAFFRGGVVAYANEIKRDLLGVPQELLEEHGAVSRPVAEAMATGCRARLACDWALAVTGIAGPDGGTAEKPLGTTWIGVAGPTGTWGRRYHFPGTRARIRVLAVSAALDTLRRLLEVPEAPSPWLPTDTWGREG
jgi:nicotinamide-nucleotide amidase